RFRASVEAVRRGAEPPADGYQGAYVEELARVDGDPVPAMLDRIVATLHRFRVDFDSFVREAELEPQIPDAIARLDTYESEGTLWARTSQHGDDKDRPMRRRELPLLRRRRRLPAAQAGPVRPGDLRPRRRSPRLRRTAEGGGGDDGVRPRPCRGADLPARPPDERRRATQDVEAPRRRRLPRRLPRRDRRRRGALVPGQPRPRPDDRDRRRPRRREEPEEPGVLRPVRARAHRRHPPERGEPAEGGRGPAAARAAGARAGEAPRRVPRRRARGDGAPRAAGATGLRDQGRRRLPPLLPRPARPRLGVGVVPPRALPG